MNKSIVLATDPSRLASLRLRFGAHLRRANSAPMLAAPRDPGGSTAIDDRFIHERALTGSHFPQRRYREQRAHHSKAHRALVDLSLHLDAQPVPCAGNSARELVLISSIDDQCPMPTFNVTATNGALELHW